MELWIYGFRIQESSILIAMYIVFWNAKSLHRGISMPVFSTFLFPSTTALYQHRILYMQLISQFPEIPWQCLACLRQPPGLCSASGSRSQCLGDILSTSQVWFGTALRRVQRSSGHSQGCLISISCYFLDFLIVLGDIPCANFRYSPRDLDFFRPCDIIQQICLDFQIEQRGFVGGAYMSN